MFTAVGHERLLGAAVIGGGLVVWAARAGASRLTPRRVFTALAALSLLACVAGVVLFGLNYAADLDGWTWFHRHEPGAFWQILAQRLSLCAMLLVLPLFWFIGHRRRRNRRSMVL